MAYPLVFGQPYTLLNIEFPLRKTHFVKGKSFHDYTENSPQRGGGGYSLTWAIIIAMCGPKGYGSHLIFVKFF